MYHAHTNRMEGRAGSGQGSVREGQSTRHDRGRTKKAIPNPGKNCVHSSVLLTRNAPPESFGRRNRVGRRHRCPFTGQQHGGTTPAAATAPATLPPDCGDMIRAPGPTPAAAPEALPAADLGPDPAAGPVCWCRCRCGPHRPGAAAGQVDTRHPRHPPVSRPPAIMPLGPAVDVCAG